jgi:Domain of unknown function (DUF4384)/Caspase domain
MIIRPVLRPIALSLLFVAFASPTTNAQDKPAPGPEHIVQEQPPFYAKVDVDHKNREYREGDRLSLNVVSEEDAYIYALYQQADGKIYQIFPNAGQKDNHIRAKAHVTFPGEGDRFVWKVGPPFGKELIKIVASKEPIADLQDPALRAKIFNPITKAQVKDISAKLDKGDAKPWTEDQVEITTHDKSWEPPPPPKRRVGVFFSVGELALNEFYKEACEGKDSLNRPGVADAQVLERLFREQGQLDESKIFLDADTSREKIEGAITNWLPSVTKPGDTVFIYYTGHGAAIESKKKNDPHVRGSYLCPYDFVCYWMLVGMVQRQKEGKLTDDEAKQLQTYQAWIKGLPLSQIDEELAKHKGITDDQFGHWLQRLAGRQIVIMLNACHSAGFADEGKDLFGKEQSFDFLTNEMSRLKDLGQSDTALIAAAGAKESTLSYRELDSALDDGITDPSSGVEAELKPNEKFSALGYYIADSLLRSPRPTKIEDTFANVQRGMKEYIERLNAHMRRHHGNEVTPYEPHLFNHCSSPVLIKP